ncbi:DUF4376 domain-containing protein [Avibacterium paragallinarum]|uniref:DUF4376 domain-containing protein n=1 Tax=Avibacterium paragallinarum TaxID=728 RepID=UPI001F5E2D82|nr:DUF4376 domain-containing protein [Avibacterium paragallinarum]
MYYRAGFYLDLAQAPEGAVGISDETYRTLLEGQSEGKQIISDERGYPVLIEPQPSPYHRLQGGKWVMDEARQGERLCEQRNQVRSKINAKRDACVNGGVYVPAIEKWVDTDEKGRATLVEIKADFDLNGKTEENGEPRIFTLICADNTAQPLDFDKFKAVWNAAKTLKEKMFENAYMHKVLLEAEENPTEYDWSIGWSQTYEEYQNEQEKSI